MKKLLIVVGIVVVLLAAAVAILVANLDKVVDSKKEYILEQAETALGRSVTIDEIGVTLSRGIGVKLRGVAIADDPAFSGEPFVEAGDLTVRVKLWPLIRKQIEIKRLVLNDPVINVTRDENGTFNFDSMISSPQPGGGAATSSDAPPAAAATVVLAFADIKNGTILFEDRTQNLRLDVRRIDFTARNAGLGQKAIVELKAAIASEEQNVEVSGTVGPVQGYETPDLLRPTPVDLGVSLGPLTAGQIERFLPAGPATEQLKALDVGDVRATFKIMGSLGALEVSSAELTAALFGAVAPNIVVRLRTKPVDVLAVGGGNPPDVAFEGNAELGPLPLDKLLVQARAAGGVPPELEMSGDGTASVEFDGTPGAISISASVDLVGGSVRFGEQFIKQPGTPMGLSSSLIVGPESVGIEKSTVTVGTMVFDATGRIDLAGDVPALDMAVNSRPIDIATVTAMLPALVAYSPAGRVELTASVKGTPGPGSLPNVDGTLTLEKGAVTLPQIPQPVTGARATLRFTESGARVENGEATVGRSALQFRAEATSFEPMEATYRVTSSEAWRADFNTPPKPAARPEVLRDVRVEGRLWQEGELIRNSGTAVSPAGSVANLDYRDLKATIGSTKDRVEIESYSVKTLGGTVEGSGAFLTAAEPPSFELSTQVRNVNLAEYFKYKVESIPRFIDGTIDVDLDLAGAGQEWQAIQPTLSGKGGAVVIKGALLDFNIANDLLHGIGQLPLVDAAAINRVRQKNPKLFSGANTGFQDLRGEFRIENGRIHSRGLVLKSADYSIFGEGWVSLDRQMNLKTTIVFSAAATRDIAGDLSVVKYLTNDKGQLEIPVSLIGSIMKPRLVPDIDALSSRIQDSAIDAGVDKLRDGVGDQVKDLLKGWGKKSTTKKDTTRTP